MTERVEGFEHRPGAHCGSTSLRNLAAHHGWGFDEPTCFGLASGLGFTYFERPEAPWRTFFGRPLWLEVAFFEHLSIPHDHRERASWADARAAIRDGVDRDRPVMLFVDLYYLDYYEADTHFAPHSLLAVGYDDDRVVLSDSEFDELQELPVERLREALTSKHVVPLEHRHLVVTDPEPAVPAADAARAAIRETARYMLDPGAAARDPGPGEHGVPGIRALAGELPAWTELPDPAWAARFAYQNVERRGTGGGAFRRLYADFLEWAVERVPAVPADAPRRMHAIADDWTAAGDLLREASEADRGAMADRLAAASEALLEVADREAALFEDLRRI